MDELTIVYIFEIRLKKQAFFLLFCVPYQNFILLTFCGVCAIILTYIMV